VVNRIAAKIDCQSAAKPERDVMIVYRIYVNSAVQNRKRVRGRADKF
jgi:hypothetical protein